MSNMTPRTTWLLLMVMTFTGKGIVAQDCGVAPLNAKIAGGENATAGSWPWQVSIHLATRGHICGGTLISDQWVLTAAHCILVNSISAWTLYLGRETQAGPNPNEVSSTVSQVIVHPDYNNTLYNNDVALMKLSSPVTFNNYIRKICLANGTSQFFNSTLCWATGWGMLSKTETLPASQPLQQVQIPVVGNKQCSCNYVTVKEANITSKMICAGQENKGSCQGDSGGPLQCKQGSSWIQAGITSFGIPCSQAGFPEVYARVSQFETWIRAQVAGTQVSFVEFNSVGTDQDSSFVCRSSGSCVKPSAQLALIVFVTILLYHV